MGRCLWGHRFHGGCANSCKLDWKTFHYPIGDVADLAKHCPNLPVHQYGNVYRAEAEKSGFQICHQNRIPKLEGLILGLQPGNKQGCQLRHGCALKIQRFTLAKYVFLTIVNLIRAILDRCCTGVLHL